MRLLRERARRKPVVWKKSCPDGSRNGLANCRLGLMINFGTATMSEGISRVVNDLPSD